MRELVDTRNAADLERFLVGYSSAEDSPAFAQLIQLSGKRNTLSDARRLITNARSRSALDRLERLWSVIESLQLADRFEIDLGDVSRLDTTRVLLSKSMSAAPEHGSEAAVVMTGLQRVLAGRSRQSDSCRKSVLELMA